MERERFSAPLDFDYNSLPLRSKPRKFLHSPREADNSDALETRDVSTRFRRVLRIHMYWLLSGCCSLCKFDSFFFTNDILAMLCLRSVLRLPVTLGERDSDRDLLSAHRSGHTPHATSPDRSPALVVPGHALTSMLQWRWS